MMILGMKSAERFVREQREAGNNVKWDGWTMVFFHANQWAAQSPKPTACFDRETGEWGFQTRVEVNDEGKWEVDQRNVKHIRRSRNRR